MNSALELAAKFHESYERLAPSFGYSTRPDTREFRPDSQNGRLMVAVCEELFTAANERIKQTDDFIQQLADHTEKAEAELIAEREVSDKLEKALKLAEIQYMGCGGNLRPEEVVSAMRRVVQNALAEVAAIRNKQ